MLPLFYNSNVFVICICFTFFDSFYRYIRLPPLGGEAGVCVLSCCYWSPSLNGSLTPPAAAGLWLRRTPPTRAQTRSGIEVVSRLVFEWVWSLISGNSWYPNRSQIGPRFKLVSRLVFKLIFASKTKDRCIFEKTKIRKMHGLLFKNRLCEFQNLY